MRLLTIPLILFVLVSCVKDDSIHEETLSDRYNVGVEAKFDRGFFGVSDTISTELTVTRAEISSALSPMELRGIKVSYNKQSKVLAGDNQRVTFVAFEAPEAVFTIEIEYINGKIVKSEAKVPILESSKIDSIWDVLRPEMLTRWENEAVVKINTELETENDSRYEQDRLLNIFPLKGFVGVHYFYFDDHNVLDSVKVHHGDMDVDNTLTILGVYNDLSDVYGEGEVTGIDDSQYTITTDSTIIKINQVEKYIITDIKRKTSNPETEIPESGL